MKPATIVGLLLVFALTNPSLAPAQQFTQTNLVSDVAGNAARTDANLVNPWGLAPSAGGVFWTSNQGTNTSSLYDPDGTIRSLVVTVPGGPTGIVATAATDSAFDVPNDTTTARAAFIFVTLAGTVAAWSPAVNQTNAIVVGADTGSVYTGAALGGPAASPRLYAADFAQGEIDVYDTSFVLTTTSGAFIDPTLPSGYYPFNVANVGGQLYVSYAQRTQDGRALPGDGLGIVSVFDLEGNFVRRFATGGELDAPWAVVQAPPGFDLYGGSILIGNFGDGRILAYDTGTSAFRGALLDTLDQAIVLDGLWGLSFGRAASGPEVANRLYFAAGVGDELHGLFGYIAVADTTGEPPVVECEVNDPEDLAFWRDECGDERRGNGRGHGWGHFPGHHPHGLPPGHDRDGDGRDDHGFGSEPSEMLEDLFEEIEDDPAPNAFGDEGCFFATCELLGDMSDESDEDQAAQALLVTRLNLHAGNLCDSLAVACEGAPGGVDVLTLGEVADSLDVLLCEDGDSDDIRDLTELLLCVNGYEPDDDDGDDDRNGRDRQRAFHQKIRVKLGMNPVRLTDGAVGFAVSASQPMFIQMRVYDARGRLIAEPMRSEMVVGSVSVSWDGRDLSGRRVAPGTYFYRAVSGNEAVSGRMLLIH